MFAFVVACADPPAPPASADPPPVETCAPGGEGSDPYVPAEAAALAEVVQREVDAWPAAGIAIATGRGDALTFSAGFGSADPLTGLAATADTPFLLGSVSKTVIGVLAMQLVEEGRLDLDADVGPIVGYDVRNPYHPDVPITVRMLLTHTSTLWDTPATWDSTGWTAGDAEEPMEAFVAAYFTPGDPRYGGRDAWWEPAPGELYCYSNMAVALAAVAIEHVAGDDLESLAQARIFGPLGMDRTSYRIDAYCDPADLARGVAWDGERFVADDNSPYGQPEGHPELASGMVRSTANDLLRFATAIGAGGGPVLTPASTDAMLERQLDPDLPTCGDGRGSPGEQGVVWMHLPDANGDWVGHYGGVEGFMSSMWLIPGDDLRYAIVSNQSDGALYAIEAAMYAELTSPSPAGRPARRAGAGRR